jgi:hypothetical protein
MKQIYGENTDSRIDRPGLSRFHFRFEYEFKEEAGRASYARMYI